MGIIWRPSIKEKLCGRQAQTLHGHRPLLTCGKLSPFATGCLGQFGSLTVSSATPDCSQAQELHPAVHSPSGPNHFQVLVAARASSRRSSETSTMSSSGNPFHRPDRDSYVVPFSSAMRDMERCLERALIICVCGWGGGRGSLCPRGRLGFPG